LKWVGSILGSGLVAGVVAGIILALMAPIISENIAYLNPTCDDPRGLRVIPSTDIKVAGPTFKDEDADPYQPKDVLDGNPGSMWAPESDPAKGGTTLAVFSSDAAKRTLTLTFSAGAERDVALVCVVNGLASEPWRYRNYGRVKNIKAWPDESSTRELSTLRTLADGEMQNLQQIRIDAGRMRSLHLEPIDTYAGEITQSFDPDNCNTRDQYEDQQRDPNGCIVDPTPNAGLAEVTVFEVDPDAPGFWERLSPWDGLLPWA
jgi:hypothetical protein